ncbi:MAG TPA: hypothetical protein VHB79_25460 [Polyangiaceae bacterium]|nr:hypothetical protein [Polyangiaceae bacterium]
MKRAAALVLLACGSCHPHAATHPAKTTSIASCSYEVALRANGTAHVDASCGASGAVTFRAPQLLLRDLHDLPPSKSGRFAANAGKLSYSVDLATLSTRGRDIDLAAHLADSFFAPMSNVLLVPEPLTTEIPVKVHVSAESGLSYAVGLTRDKAPDTYQLMAHEIPVATYFAFGKLQQRELDLNGAKLEVTRLDGELDQSFDDVTQWIRTSANAVRDFYGAFPVPRASLSVLPIPERDAVVFGKVLPESEPGVALLLGQHATRKSLYSDWILVHELFHLGFPSFFEEGKWLDEGLATYYEPVIRVRAGLYTETELWNELEKDMPQGLPAFTTGGLEQANDFRGIYWGGAIASLVADVEARKRKVDAGLEVGLRALRDAGGTACEVWTLAEVVGAVDHALGAPTLEPIVRDHAQRGSPFDLHALFQQLGVNRDAQGAVQLSDSAPLAAVRRAITAKP